MSRCGHTNEPRSRSRVASHTHADDGQYVLNRQLGSPEHFEAGEKKPPTERSVRYLAAMFRGEVDENMIR